MADKKSYEANVKSIISGLVTSSPLALTVWKLQIDYKNMIGEDIPYNKLGYNSLEHFLLSIPDTLRVMGHGPHAELRPVVSEKSAHINELVVKQKITSSKSKRSAPVRRRLPAIIKASHEERRPASKIVYPKQQNNNNREQPKNSNSKKTENTQQTKSQPVHIYSNQEQENNPNYSRPRQNVNYNQCQQSYKENCQKGESSTVSSTSTDSFIRNFDKNYVDTSLQHQYVSKEIQCEFMPERLTSKSIQIKLDDIFKSFEKDEVAVPIPVEVQNNLKTLISLYPEGLWCGQLPDQYRARFKKYLDYEEYGYKSLIAMCMDLPEVFHYVRPSQEDFKLYDRSRPLPKEVEKTFTMASYTVKTPTHMIEKPLPDLQTSQFEDYLPSDIVLDEIIPRQFIPESVTEGDYLEIVIAEIWDISKFWIYLPFIGLDDMMDNLQPFYEENYEKYLIPEAFVKEGLYCVCKFYKEYHRAVIVRVVEDKPEVKVFFADYGTVISVDKSTLCFLTKEFGQLPFQSIRSRLANIYPLTENMTWSKQDIQIFFDLIKNRNILGQVNKILPEKQIVDLYLIDADTKECINDLLVREKIALYTNQPRTRIMKNCGYKPLVKYLHLFPSFIDLEFGLAPCTADFLSFSEMGITYDLSCAQYFHRSVDEQLIRDIETKHDIFIEKAKERYRKSTLFPKLTPHNIIEIQYARNLDMTLFGCIKDDLNDFLLNNNSSSITHQTNAVHDNSGSVGLQTVMEVPFDNVSDIYECDIFRKHKDNNELNPESVNSVINNNTRQLNYLKISDDGANLDSLSKAVINNCDTTSSNFSSEDVIEESFRWESRRLSTSSKGGCKEECESNRVDDEDSIDSDVGDTNSVDSDIKETEHHEDCRECPSDISSSDSAATAISNHLLAVNSSHEPRSELKKPEAKNQLEIKTCTDKPIEEKVECIVGDLILFSEDSDELNNVSDMSLERSDESACMQPEKLNGSKQPKSEQTAPGSTTNSLNCPPSSHPLNGDSQKFRPNTTQNWQQHQFKNIPPPFYPPAVNKMPCGYPPQPSTVYYSWSNVEASHQNNSQNTTYQQPPHPSGSRFAPPTSNVVVPPPPGFHCQPRALQRQHLGASQAVVHPAMMFPHLQPQQPIYVFNHPTFLFSDSSTTDFFSMYNNLILNNQAPQNVNNPPKP